MHAAARTTTDKAENATVTSRVPGQPTRQFPQLGDIALLQRTLGNQAVQRLFAPVRAAQRSSSLENQVVQRIITVGGFYAALRTDKANDDFKKLPDTARAEIERQHKDRSSIYSYPDRPSMYAYAAGDVSKAPTVTAVEKPKLENAKRRKNRLSYGRANKYVGKITDNKNFNAPEQRGLLPAWYPMSQTGLDKKSISFTFNKDIQQHELSYKKNLSADQQAEVDKMSVTTWEEQGTDALDYIANLGEDVASSFTDTDVTSRPTSDRDSDMGGFSSSTGDFKESTVGSSGKHITDKSTQDSGVAPSNPTTTIGHQIAYRDTITQIKKKRRVVLGTGEVQALDTSPKTTDQQQEPLPGGLVPSSMSPEQYDIGQHGRRTQVERKTRKRKGAYLEVNELGPDSGTVEKGLKIPSQKYYSTVSKDRKTREDYKFDQYAPVYSEKEKSGGWTKHYEKSAVKSTEVPQQEYYESDEEMHFSDEEKEPSTPAMMFSEESTFTSPTKLQLGQPLGMLHDGYDDWYVENVMAETTAGIQYRLLRWTS
jgi:hypothetical protein